MCYHICKLINMIEVRLVISTACYMDLAKSSTCPKGTDAEGNPAEVDLVVGNNISPTVANAESYLYCPFREE